MTPYKKLILVAIVGVIGSMLLIFSGKFPQGSFWQSTFCGVGFTMVAFCFVRMPKYQLEDIEQSK